MKRLIRIMIFTLAALLLISSVYAGTLSSLINGGDMVAGDKLFDQWTVNYYTSEAGRTFNAANIEITPLHDGDLDPGPGLQFEAFNNELKIAGDGTFAYIDLTIGFRVSVLDPHLAIKDSSLALSSFNIGWAVDIDDYWDVGVYIHESIGTAAGLDDLGTNSVEDSQLRNPDECCLETWEQFDSASFAPQSEIWVSKNIMVWAADTGDQAELWSFEQRFSQQSTVPEPSALLLMVLGIVGTAAVHRFRRH